MDKIDFNANPLTFFNNYIIFDVLPQIYLESLSAESNSFYDFIDKEGYEAFNRITNFREGSSENDHKTRVLHYIKEIEYLRDRENKIDLRSEVIETLNKVLISLERYLAELYGILPNEDFREEIRVNSYLMNFKNKLTSFQTALFYGILDETKEATFFKSKFKSSTYKLVASKYEINVKDFEIHFSSVAKIIKSIKKPIGITKKDFRSDILLVMEELEKYNESINILEPSEPQEKKKYPKSIFLANELLKKLD